MIDRACISITSKCQLHCRYCHFDKHIDKSSCADICVENLKTIIENIIEYAGINQINFKIGLVGAGEPLLRFDLIQEAVVFAEKNDLDKRLLFYTISNGIDVDKDKINWFHRHRDRIKISFSLDGSKSIHNMCRVFASKAGSFEKVLETISLYKQFFGEAPSINATVHKQTINMADSELKFFEENFSEVCFSRLVDENSAELNISKSEFDGFMDLAANTKLSLRQLRKPLKHDCTMYGQLCGVGITNIFYANGKVYPCGRFIGMKKYELGTETSSLFDVETNMKQFAPIEAGKCYFDEKVGKNC